MEYILPIVLFVVLTVVFAKLLDPLKHMGNVPPVRPKLSSAVPDWECPTCGNLNDFEDDWCVVCMEDRYAK